MLGDFGLLVEVTPKTPTISAIPQQKVPYFQWVHSTCFGVINNVSLTILFSENALYPRWKRKNLFGFHLVVAAILCTFPDVEWTESQSRCWFFRRKIMFHSLFAWSNFGRNSRTRDDGTRVSVTYLRRNSVMLGMPCWPSGTINCTTRSQSGLNRLIVTFGRD